MEEGKKAPNFKLKDMTGKEYTLDDFKSKYIILYFYPKDSTVGCLLEAKMFSKDIDKFKQIKAEIIGISGGNEKTKLKFVTNNNLKIKLLSDTDFKIAKEYDVYGEKKMMGRTYLGISRSTFILDQNRNIIKIFEKVKPISHSKEVYDFINNL